MTEDELQAIERRANAATSGPWYPIVTDDELFQGAAYVGLDQRGRFAENPAIYVDDGRGMKRLLEEDMDEERVIAITCLQYPRLACPDECDQNAVFIAHARDDVPRLIAEIRRLQEILERREQNN